MKQFQDPQDVTSCFQTVGHDLLLVRMAFELVQLLRVSKSTLFIVYVYICTYIHVCIDIYI